MPLYNPAILQPVSLGAGGPDFSQEGACPPGHP